MGYTHYFTFKKPLSLANFNKVKKDLKLIESHLANQPEPIILRNGLGEGKGVYYSNNRIAFNGDASNDLDYETFGFSVGDNDFEFCKTQYRPYDLAVCLTLRSLNYHVGKDIEISSDGDKNDWKESLEVYKELFPDRPKGTLKF